MTKTHRKLANGTWLQGQSCPICHSYYHNYNDNEALGRTKLANAIRRHTQSKHPMPQLRSNQL